MSNAKKYAWLAFLGIAILTGVFWLVNQYFVPLLPKNINSSNILLLAIASTLISLLAGFKDIIELFQMLIPFNESSKVVHHNLPQPDYKKFIGRRKEIKEIKELLKPESRHFVITIDGIGGVGKTTLALKIANDFVSKVKDVRKKDRFKHIIWTTAKKNVLTSDGIIPHHQNIIKLEDIHASIASVFEKKELLPMTPSNQNNFIRQLLTKSRSLVIVDNLETIDDERLLSFIKDIPSPTKVIVTTRNRIDVAYPVRLMGMNSTEASLLVDNETERKGVTLKDEEKSKLIERTGGIPLALTWSIGLISFGHSPESVLHKLGNQSSDVSRFCFSESIDQIRGKPAYEILLAIAVLEGRSDRNELGNVMDLSILDRDEGLVALEKLSLINKVNENFEVLPLTYSYIKEELKDNKLDWQKIVAPYLERYLQSLRNYVEEITTIWQRGKRNLKELYVPPKFFKYSIEFNNLRTASFIDFPQIKEEDKVILVGKQGVGKTTFLKYYISTILDEVPLQIPILLRVRELNLNVSLFQSIAQSFENVSLPNTELYLKQLLISGSATIFFDGLDEAFYIKKFKKRFIEELTLFHQYYPETKIVITSRPDPIFERNDFFSRFTKYEFSDFNLAQVSEFAHKWFGDSKLSDSFLEVLQTNDFLENASKAPLLLNYLLSIYASYGKLPIGRANIIENTVRIMLERWDVQRSITRPNPIKNFSIERQVEILGGIGFYLFQNQKSIFSTKEFHNVIINGLGLTEILDESQSLLYDFTSQGIIIEESMDNFSFIHKSFQDYFAANFIIANIPSLLTGIMKEYNLQYWREVYSLTTELASKKEYYINELYLHLRNELEQNKKLQSNWEEIKWEDPIEEVNFDLKGYVNKKMVHIESSDNESFILGINLFAEIISDNLKPKNILASIPQIFSFVPDEITDLI